MRARIWAALIAIYLAWGSTYLAIHYAIQSIPPFFMTGIRFLVAGLILYGWRRLAGDPKPTPAQWRSGIIIGNLLLAGGIGSLAWAEQFVPSGISALIIAATPLWIVLIEAIRRDGNRPSRLNLLGVLVGLAGMVILIDPWKTSGANHTYNLLGVIVLLLAALSWSIGSIYSHTADQPKSALLGTGMELLAGSAGSFILGILTGEVHQVHFNSITSSSLIGLGYLIIVGSLIGFVCYTWLLREAPTTLVVTYAYVNPLVAILVGSWIAKEAITPAVFISTPLILSAIVFIQAKKTEKGEAQQKLVAMAESGGDD